MVRVKLSRIIKGIDQVMQSPSDFTSYVWRQLDAAGHATTVIGGEPVAFLWIKGRQAVRAFMVY